MTFLGNITLPNLHEKVDFKTMTHFRIYRNDGIFITNKIMSKTDIINWLNDSQQSLN